MTYLEYRLPQHLAADRLRSMLREGPSLSMSRFAFEAAIWRSASFTTWAKSGLTNGELLSLEEGGKTTSSEADDWLFSKLKQLGFERDARIVVEDWRATPDSAFLQDRGMPAFFSGGEVYYLCPLDPREHPHWRRIFANAVPTFHAFVVPMAASPAVGDQVDRSVVKLMAAEAMAVIFGAYDGEGYVLAEMNKS